VIETMNLARAANKYFNDSEPWNTLKSDRDHCGTTLNVCMQVVRSLAILFEPVVPELARRVWDMLSLSGAPCDAGWESSARPGLAAGHLIKKPEILVRKIEDGQLEEIMKSLSPEPSGGAAAMPPAKQTIAIEEFKKLDLRLARVVSAERIPKSDKLLKIRIEVGSETRQVIAGIAQQIVPEEMVGKTIVVLANLQPAKLMGQESQGMLLAATDSKGKLGILTVDRELESGSTIS
jgi:methionyl-tRNA synthetase